MRVRVRLRVLVRVRVRVWVWVWVWVRVRVRFSKTTLFCLSYLMTVDVALISSKLTLLKTMEPAFATMCDVPSHCEIVLLWNVTSQFDTKITDPSNAADSSMVASLTVIWDEIQ